MKNLKLYALACILSLLFIPSAFAQVPQGMNYQAIARDAAGMILANKNVSIRITITNGNGGFVLYKEHHSATTNQFGLFTLNVGNGTADTATFSSINWAANVPWMEVEMDPNGGSSYVNMGTSQLLSVPYALNVGSTGQTSNAAFGTGALTITAADTTFPLKVLPGVTQSVIVPPGCKVLISSDGAVQTTATTATGFSVVDILVFVDGNFAGQGCYKRVIAANTTGLTGMIANWSLCVSKTLAAGNHTIDVRAFHAQGSTANVSGDGNSTLQGDLSVTVIKN